LSDCHREISVRRSIVTAVLLLFGLAPAFADVRILASPGGEVVSFLELFEVLRYSGERVIIDGPCYSACTLVLSTISRNRICVTSKAVLGFHAPRVVDRYGREYEAGDATRLMTATYPAAIRAWIERRGGLMERPIFLRGRELAALYPHCS
jgi:ATP-dependent protease ClpP protease subunit